jgi:glycosyltransferase involved in cell wall biosynthesis
VENINAFLGQSPVATKILFVNDGSTDKSSAIIESYCTRNANFSCIELSKNSGLSTAIKAGIDHCDTEWIGYIDSDNQTTPMDFLLFFPHLREFDMVTGIRARRIDSITKKLSSLIANWFRNRMINDGIADTGCPLKILKTEFAKRMPFFDGMHRFIPALVQLQGGRVKQIPVQHFPRAAGVAKYNLWNRLRKPFFDTLAFRWMKKRYINYTISRRIGS